MEVDLITAPGDGLGPAVLLSLGTRMKAQYLFNVPEGFSRFVLEHKLRPGLGLRAVFCPDLIASTGLPGLLMRLRGEGHGQVELLGPSGTLPFIASLRHFVRWKYPAVLVNELINLPGGNQDKEEDHHLGDDYNDEHLSMKCIWVYDNNANSGKIDWKLPDWLSGNLNTTAPSPLDEDDDDSGTSSDTSSSSSSSSSSDSDTSSSSDDSTSSSDASSSEDEDHQNKVTTDANASAAMFASLDAAFVRGGSASGSSRLRTQALGLLKSSSKAAQKPKDNNGDGDSGSRLLEVLASLERTAAPSDPNTRHVDTRVYTRCSKADGISLLTRKQQQQQQHTSLSSPSSLVAFCCHLKLTNQVLLIVNCTTDDQIRQLITHPAVRAMVNLPKERIAGGIIMLGPGLSTHRPAQDLFSILHSSASLFIMEHPGIGARSSELGYISSARMAARLNMVNQRMFPLPLALRASQQHQPGPLAGSSGALEREMQNEIENRFYLDKLTKLVLVDGTLVIAKPKLNASEGSTATAATAAETEAIDVEKLQAAVHEADPELKSKLIQLTSSLPPAYRNHPNNVQTTTTASNGKILKRQLESQMEENAGNKRAAATLQAQLKQRTNSDVPFKPPPPPNPPPPPPPPSANSHLDAPSPPEPEVIFLGTGSAEPSQHRGASAIYLNPGNGHGGFLLDCGEGCYGQLVRFYGSQGASALISNLAAIWISHRHADHMAGILQILAHYPSNLPPLFLIGPGSLRNWLHEATPALGLGHRYMYAHCNEVQQPHHWGCHRICSSLGLLGIATVPVRHCSDAFGIVLRHRTGWSLVYSGDTEPSEALVRAGSGATLLIHEATFEPLLITEARKKRHSTSVEAMDVARRMGAYSTVLTHFSQRYPKFPEGVAEAVAQGIERGENNSFGVAFDGMCLPLGLLQHVPAVTVAVQAVLVAATAASDKEKK